MRAAPSGRRGEPLMAGGTRVAVLGTRFGPADLEAEELAGLEVMLVPGSGATPDELVQAAAGAAVILAGAPPKFSRAVLERLPDCRAIVRYGVGTETIDLAAATERGIMVVNVPDYCTEEVATHTLALILACERRLLAAGAGVVQGQWQISHLRPLFSTEQQTLGILGFGRIGQAVARKAAAFGFTILVHDPVASEAALASQPVRPVGLDELLARSDVLSLNAPLTPGTYHVIDAAALARMKPTAFLVNTARGGLVDEAALAEALRAGRLAGAALDVLETEPPPPDHPLLGAERCLLTPHMAWYSEQAAERMRRLAAREVARVLRGEPPLNLVNPAVLASTPPAAASGGRVG